MDIPPPIPTTDPYFSLNPIHFPITCASSSAQEWFDRGLTLCYAFNHEEAHRCFLQCLAHDEKCMMGYWGVGYALGANYNKAWELFEPGEVDRAVPMIITALKTIDQVSAQGTDLETALVNALRARMPADDKDRNYSAWNKAYAEAMKTVYDSFPDNIDVATLYADSLMSLTPWRLWNIKTGEPAPGSRALEAQQVLERGMKQSPSHPGILHFYVHLTEMSATPEKALPAANALVGLVPDAGHLEHMPSHIYVLMGDYARAIACNERGIIADEKYRALRGPGGFYLVYRLHNMQFIVYSAMFAGQYEVAMRHVEMIERHVPEQLLESLGHFIEATYAIRFQVYVRFGRWREIIALQPPKREQVFPITTAFVHWSKAIAYSATRDVASAEKERLLYLEAYDKIPSTSLMFPNTAHDVLAIGTAFLDGELEYRKGNFSEAFSHLEESIRRYDSLVYCEPWSWLTPVRHAYAALKLEQGHTEEALEVYYDDLGFNDTLARANQHPNNVWALTGAYECLLKLGREREAKIVWPLLRAARAVADVDVDVSCFCRIDDVARGRDLVEQGEVGWRMNQSGGRKQRQSPRQRWPMRGISHLFHRFLAQMSLPAALHLRPWLRRYTRLSPPSSPRTDRGPAIGNLEDAVGALERWWVGERERTAPGGWRGWVSRAPLIAAFSILGMTYVPFVVWVGHDQMYIIHKQGWRYLAVLIAYHTLLGMTGLSLYRASTIRPGSPHQRYARPRHIEPDSEAEADFRGISVAEWRRRRGEKSRGEAEEDDLPLSAVKALERTPMIPSDVEVERNDAGSPYPPPSPPPISSENRLLRRWCKECQGWKPPRCHHCRTCGVCVLKMDHHCLWLNTCIGYANHKAFLLFLLYATAFSAFVAEETGYVIWKWLDGGQVVDITDFRPVANLLLCIIAITFLLSIGSFFCFHIYLAMNNRTTLENLRPCLPPAALIESGPATPSSLTPDPPPAYSPRPTPASPSSRHTRLPPHPRDPNSPARRYIWQWRWKPDHLLSRNERKLVRHVAESVNMYDTGDAWTNLMTVLAGEDTDEGDLEMGGTGQRRRGRFARAARWFWPSSLPIQGPTSLPASRLPGHEFPISPHALDIIRHKTYGLRTRRRIPLRRSVDPDDDTESEEGLARSSNEFEFDSEEGYEVDEIEEYGMI